MDFYNLLLLLTILLCLYYFTDTSFLFIFAVGLGLYYMNDKKGYMVLIALIVLYILVYSIFGKTNQLTDIADSQYEINIPSSSLTNLNTATLSYNYSYSIWFYINDWSFKYGQQKIIFGHSLNSLGVFSPVVYLDEEANDLIVQVSMQNSSNTHECRIKNIQLQKWCNLVVCVRSKVLDLYLNGKLVKSCIMEDVPTSISGNRNISITPNGGFSGYTSRFSYYPYAMNTKEAWDIYKSGYTDNSLLFSTGYNLRMGLYNKNKKQAELRI